MTFTGILLNWACVFLLAYLQARILVPICMVIASLNTIIFFKVLSEANKE